MSFPVLPAPRDLAILTQYGTLTPELRAMLAFQVCMVLQLSPSIHGSSLLWTELHTPPPNLYVEGLTPNVTYLEIKPLEY